jgi:hypothetical protein
MENFISIRSQFNLINLGYTKKSIISKLVLLNSRIIVLLSTNDIIIYDTNSDQPPPKNSINKHFSQEIKIIKAFQDKLFIIQNQLITQLDITNLDELQKYDLKEKPYLLSFKDTKKNLLCFYVNEIHEILYMDSYFFTKIVRLYKETEQIQEMVYKNNILFWCTKSALKVFNLVNKHMLVRKDLTNYKINTNENNKCLIDCYLYNNLLGLIYQQKYIFIYYLDLSNENNEQNSNTSFELYNTCISPNNTQEYYIGLWFNIALTKICILSLKNDIVCINIAKFGPLKKIYFYQSKVINCYFHKEYKYIKNPEHDMRFAIGEKNMYIYDNKEVYLIYYSQDKENNFFLNFLNSDEIDFKEIEENYINMDLNKKYFVLIKLIEKNSYDDFDLFLNNKIFLEHYKYIYEVLFIPKNKDNENNMDKINILYNNYVQYLLKTSIKLFDKLYQIIKNKFDKLTDKTKENIIKELTRQKQYKILKKFIITDNTNILYSSSLENFIMNYKSINENNIEIKNKIIYIEALLNIKALNYKKALKLFIEINNDEEIYNLLLDKNQTLLIFDNDKIFQILDESKLVTLLNNLYSSLHINICLKFYDKLFSHCDEIKITKFSYYLILYEKFRLLINADIIMKIFNISLRNNNTMMFENIYEKYKYKSDNKLFLTKFIREVFGMFNIDNKKIVEENTNELMKKQNIDIYILLLTNIGDYKKIIDIYIDLLEQPEECIKYIENSNLNQNIKNDIYNYLGNKINTSKSLSETKKFYYITQFQDDITIQKPDILKLFDKINYNKNEKDDFDYILLILKELRLKLNTLQISEEMSLNSRKENSKLFKKNLLKGKVLELDVKENLKKNEIKCAFDECDKNIFQLDDDLIIFKECNHFFHKDCFENIKNIYKNDITKFYIENDFCPKCNDVI